MLSDEELLDRDTSDSIFANETPREDSPRTLTRHLINHFGISSKGGTETVINNTQSVNSEASSSSSGIVSSLSKVDEMIKTELIDPLRQILKDKSRASAKCDLLRSCLAHKTIPKGVTPNVPLKILNAPKDLEDKWQSILQDCGRNLTLTLINYHQGQIASFEQLAEETILNGTQMILPEYITEFPDIPVKIENSLQDLLCEVTVSAKRLRKRPPNNTNNNTKKCKPNAKEQPPKNEAPLDDQPSTSSKNEETPPKKQCPWRPLKLKKKKQEATN